MVTFDAHGPGTPSSAWADDGRLAAAPSADLSWLTRLVVVAAHPDDETLGCGGLIAAVSRRGIPVRVIAVTDGSASHPRSRTITAQALRIRRADELREAVARLAPRATITWLGFPDGRTADFAEAIEDRLREELLEAAAGTLVAVTWAGDGHRDHRVVGGIVSRTAPPGAAVWSYPIWAWHWATPGGADLPWQSAVIVTLSDDDLERKRSAISAYVTQIEPLSDQPGDERVLEPGVLEHFARDRELFFATGRREDR